MRVSPSVESMDSTSLKQNNFFFFFFIFLIDYDNGHFHVYKTPD